MATLLRRPGGLGHLGIVRTRRGRFRLFLGIHGRGRWFRRRGRRGGIYRGIPIDPGLHLGPPDLLDGLPLGLKSRWDTTDTCIALGISAVVVGVRMFSLAAALVVGGLTLAGLAVLWPRR